MNVFDFDPAQFRDQYAQQGWIHIRDGIDRELLDALRDFASGSFDSHLVEGRAIGGAKAQAAYEFPPEVAFPDHLFDVVAEVSGLQRDAMTLSERHIKAYDDD